MSSNQFDESSFTRPEHHVHPSSEPLPGARGAAPTADYSPTTIERTPSSAFDPNNIDHAATSHNMERTGENAFNTERPLNVEPAPQGGVAVGGDEGAELPMGKASMGDKIIGKTQKVRYSSDYVAL